MRACSSFAVIFLIFGCQSDTPTSKTDKSVTKKRKESKSTIGGNSRPKTPVNKPVRHIKTDTLLDYLPWESFAAVHIDRRRIRDLKTVASLLPRSGVALSQQFGVGPAEVNKLLVAGFVNRYVLIEEVDGKKVERKAADISYGFAIRTENAIDRKAIAGRLEEVYEKQVEQQATFYLSGRASNSHCICLVDDRTILSGPYGGICYMLANRNIEGLLRRNMIAPISTHDIVAAVAIPPVRSRVSKWIADHPPRKGYEYFASAVNKLNAAILTFQFKPRIRSRLTLIGESKTTPAELAAMRNSLQRDFGKWLSQMADAMPGVITKEQATFGRQGIAKLKRALSAAVRAQDKSQASLSIVSDDLSGALQGVLAPQLLFVRRKALRALERNKMMQFQLAMQNYHSIFEGFPSGIYDKRGKPLLSWRVALLPMLEQSTLLEQFRLNEPWDSKHNRKLIGKMPEIFRSPDNPSKTKTTYVLPRGNGTVFADNKRVALSQITDDQKSTLMILRVKPQYAVVWTKPDELPLDEKNLKAGFVKLRFGVPVAMVDAVRWLPKDFDLGSFRSMLTPRGGEKSIELPNRTFPRTLGPSLGDLFHLELEPRAGNVAARLKSLSQLSRAITESAFKDQRARLPAAGSTVKGKGPQLSWRVSLLPFIDHGDLHAQFKLNEPWDSQHNRKLIAKMPAIFQSKGVKDVGKTSLHVFVGKGTPFGETTSAGLGDIEINDGLPNTIMLVEAGPDKAEIWTKPGGLPFDPAQDPRRLLGTVADKFFLAVTIDGAAVRLPKSIDAETLRRLIQHNDGKRVRDIGRPE